MTANIDKNPETAKRFGIFMIKYGIGLFDDNLFSIPDIDTLAWIIDALALESEPLFTIHFSTFHFFDACCSITIRVEASEENWHWDYLGFL